MPSSPQPSLKGLRRVAKVTVVVRPEHARLVSEGGAVTGTLDNVVYFGTDTHYHVRLDAGGQFIVRQQNARNGESGFAAGDRVGIAIGDDAAQIVKD